VLFLIRLARRRTAIDGVLAGALRAGGAVRVLAGQAPDLRVPRRLVAAGALLGIEVLDHVILGELALREPEGPRRHVGARRATLRVVARAHAHRRDDERF
jgi:hypothetical protein